MSWRDIAVVIGASAVCGAAVWEVIRQAFNKHLDKAFPYREED